MTRAAFLALISHWRRAPLQLFTLVAGLALATALWSGVQAINSEARASYDRAAKTLGEAQYDQILSRDGRPIPLATYVALRRAGWPVSPVIEGRVSGVRVVGIEPLTSPGQLGPLAPGTDLMTRDGAAEFGTSAALEALGLPGEVVPDMAPDTVMTDISRAAGILGTDDPTRLILLPGGGEGLLPLETVAPDLTRRIAQGGSDIGQLTDSFHLNLTAFGFLAFAVGIFIVHGAIGLAVEQRRPLVRTLRALGLPLRRLMALMAAELAALALLAGFVGLVLGYLIAARLMPDVSATLRGLYGAEVEGGLAFRPVWALSGLGIALGGAALAGTQALWGIARMPLLAAGRRALAVRSGKGRRWQGAAAVGLLILAFGLGLWGKGLALGFALLAALLIGGALALPILLDLLTRLAAGAARRVVPQWFWADTRQQLPGLSLALMALLLAMAANVGVATMVSSFRLTFQGFLDQRLAAEAYVYADTADEAARLRDWLTPRVDAILPIQTVEITLAGLPTELFGPIDHQTYRDNWTHLESVPDVWDRLHGGRGITINEQLARRSGLTLGDRVDVAGKSYEVVGIYGDYGNPVGQAMIDARDFETAFPDVAPSRFGLRLPAGKVPALFADLRQDFGLPTANMIDQAGIKAFSMGVFERTFTVTGALNILTLAVAGFAMLMSLLTLAGLRLPQLAPVWALGLTRAQLGQMELIRAILLAGFTALLALPLGLGLAWVLLAIVNVEAFGWRLPMYLFPEAYLRLGAQALAAAGLAALWPALRLARVPPADLLRVFANER